MLTQCFPHWLCGNNIMKCWFAFSILPWVHTLRAVMQWHLLQNMCLEVVVWSKPYPWFIQVDIVGEYSAGFVHLNIVYLCIILYNIFILLLIFCLYKLLYCYFIFIFLYFQIFLLYAVFIILFHTVTKAFVCECNKLS